MSERIHLSKADVTEIEEEYVLNALRSGWIAPLGPDVDAFEAELAKRVGVQHALALSSGTAALHLALLHMGARPGTVVVLPTLTFAASANAVVYTGAEPVFIDSLDSDGNVDPTLLLDAIDTLQAEGREVVAAMTVDVFGRACDYDQIEPGLADRGIPLLEDAAEALGASVTNRPAGSFGAAAALSFNGNKIMTTSGGGMLLSDRADVIERARYLATQARQPVPWYEHTEVGYNYRMSNLLAALGRGQLVRLDAMIERRRQIRRMYRDELGDMPNVRFLADGVSRDDSDDNGWLTVITLDETSTPDMTSLVAALDAEHIEARHVWKPMHLQPMYTSHRAFLTGTSERLFRTGLTLPSGASLTDNDVHRVTRSLRPLLERA